MVLNQGLYFEQHINRNTLTSLMGTPAYFNKYMQNSVRGPFINYVDKQGGGRVTVVKCQQYYNKLM